MLVVYIMLSLGFDVFPLFVKTPFYKKDEDELKEYLKALPVSLYIAENDREYVEIVKNPQFGYGKNLNPCVDCKIFFLKEAKRFMEKTGACFVVTGEVVGQRPMSQRSYSVMRAIEKRAGLKDLVLRPLSAKCLPETEMEKKGIINREKLFCISGRSRKQQMELAKAFGISSFESPAGGCLLTDGSISKRIKEMLKYGYENDYELELLSMGRHFRIGSKRFVASRNQKETSFLLRAFFNVLPFVKPYEAPGAVGVFVEKPSAKEMEIAAAILGRYSKKAEVFEYSYEGELRILKPCEISVEEIELLRI